MPNMGYCRFQNTLRDLQDCYDHLWDEDLDEYETEARRKLISLCDDIFSEGEE